MMTQSQRAERLFLEMRDAFAAAGCKDHITKHFVRGNDLVMVFRTSNGDAECTMPVPDAHPSDREPAPDKFDVSKAGQ